MIHPIIHHRQTVPLHVLHVLPELQSGRHEYQHLPCEKADDKSLYASVERRSPHASNYKFDRTRNQVKVNKQYKIINNQFKTLSLCNTPVIPPDKKGDRYDSHHPHSLHLYPQPLERARDKTGEIILTIFIFFNH